MLVDDGMVEILSFHAFNIIKKYLTCPSVIWGTCTDFILFFCQLISSSEIMINVLVSQSVQDQ